MQQPAHQFTQSGYAGYRNQGQPPRMRQHGRNRGDGDSTTGSQYGGQQRTFNRGDGEGRRFYQGGGGFGGGFATSGSGYSGGGQGQRRGGRREGAYQVDRTALGKYRGRPHGSAATATAEEDK